MISACLLVELHALVLVCMYGIQYSIWVENMSVQLFHMSTHRIKVSTKHFDFRQKRTNSLLEGGSQFLGIVSSSSLRFHSSFQLLEIIRRIQRTLILIVFIIFY